MIGPEGTTGNKDTIYILVLYTPKGVQKSTGVTLLLTYLFSQMKIILLTCRASSPIKKRQRTFSTSAEISTEREPIIRASRRTIYTAGRPPWYDSQGQQVPTTDKYVNTLDILHSESETGRPVIRLNVIWTEGQLD